MAVKMIFVAARNQPNATLNNNEQPKSSFAKYMYVCMCLASCSVSHPHVLKCLAAYEKVTCPGTSLTEAPLYNIILK